MPIPLLAIAFAWAAAGDIYRCRDASGQVQFADRPCVGVTSERLAARGEDSAASRLALQRWLKQHHSTSTGVRTGTARRAAQSFIAGGPVSEAQLSVCSERFLHCSHGNAAVMDGCVARLPRCGAGVAASSCCPQACISRYQALRQQGQGLAAAVRLALLDPSAFACADAPVLRSR